MECNVISVDAKTIRLLALQSEKQASRLIHSTLLISGKLRRSFIIFIILQLKWGSHADNPAIDELQASKSSFYRMQAFDLFVLVMTMQKQSTSTNTIFFINGINALLGWNAVLAALDYFQAHFSQYNVFSFLPIPLFVAYMIVGMLFHSISNKFQYVNLIIVGNMIVNLSMAGMLLTAIYLEQTEAGFILLLAFSFCLGIGGNVNEITIYAMINYLSSEVVSTYTVGTAISGLFITTIRVIILAITEDSSSSVPTIIYFALAIFFNILAIIMNIYFCSSEVYRDKIEAFMVPKDQNIIDQKKSSRLSSQLSKSRNKSITEEYVKQEQRIERQSYLTTIKQTFFNIFPYPLVLIANYIITFMLFPGPSLSKKFPGMPISWSVVTFLMAYNIGDTVGKYLGSIDDIFNKYSLIFALFSRCIFFFPIIVLSNGSDGDDYLLNNYAFPFFNQFIFGVTNGFVTNCTFIMAFKVSSLVYKKYAGVMCGLSLEFGIILGTFLQVPLSYLIGIG